MTSSIACAARGFTRTAATASQAVARAAAGACRRLCICGIALTGATTATGHEPGIVEACRNLVMDYAIHRDGGNHDAYAALFTEDATLSVLGETFAGRTAIHNRVAMAKDAPATRHLMSTVRITPHGNDRATGISYATVYVAPASDGVIDVEGFAAIGEYHDTFRRTDDGWKIASRRLELAMRYRDEPAPGSEASR